jgi:hypothetical protein
MLHLAVRGILMKVDKIRSFTTLGLLYALMWVDKIPVRAP